MSINAELIAEFFGKLRFDTDVSGLKKFDAMLATASKRMTALGKQADALKSKLDTTFGVRGKGASVERLKQSAALQRSMDKEFTLERKHARAKEAVFKAQLMQQKLVSAGTREQTFLQTASLKVQQAQAVAAAKEQRVLQEKLKTKQGEAKVAATLQQAQLRAARLQDVLIRRQQRSQQLARQAAKDATSFQRAEQSLIAARQRGMQLAEKHVISKAATAARESRAAERHEQQAQRFSMQQDRFQAWKMRQAEQPQGVGLAGFSVGLGGAAAALYALTAAVGYAAKRIEQRQEGVVEAQSFNNTFSSISANPKIAESFRDAFIATQMANGGIVDTETAKDFRTLAINLAETGKTQKQILAIWDTRQQAFSVAGTTKDDNRELNKQLGQMASDGTGTAADANIINNRMPMLVPHVVRAFMREKGIKDYNQGLSTFNKDLKGGKGVKYSWYEEGMKSLVEANGPALERNRNSVASQQTRADNQVYLQANDINSNQEIAGVIAERIAAERQLTESMKPLNEAFANLDVGLTKVATAMLRLASGKNADNSEKSDKDRAQDVGSAGFPEGIAIDPSVMGGGPQPSTGGEKPKDPISVLYRWLTNTPDYEQGEANGPTLGWARNSTAELKFPPLDMPKFGAEPENVTEGKYRQFRLPQPYTAEDIVAEQRRKQTTLSSDWLLPSDPNSGVINKPAGNVDQSTHNDVKVELNIDARGMDAAEVKQLSAETFHDEFNKALRTARASQTEVE